MISLGSLVTDNKKLPSVEMLRKYVVDMDEEEFSRRLLQSEDGSFRVQLAKDLHCHDDLEKNEDGELVGLPLNFCRWFGLAGQGPANELVVFDIAHLQRFLSGFFYHIDGASPRDRDESGWVFTGYAKTVENKHQNIKGGVEIALTFVFAQAVPGWETAAQKALGTQFDMRTECATGSGPFVQDVWAHTSVECVRLMTSLLTWMVLSNEEDLRYGLTAAELP